MSLLSDFVDLLTAPWASDASYDAMASPDDAVNGKPTKVAPLTGMFEQGFRPRRQIGASHMNWLLARFVDTLTAAGDLFTDHDTRIDATEGALRVALKKQTFTTGTTGSPSTWTAPANCVVAWAEGCGGGGGGGGGRSDLSGAMGFLHSGAGGGGGAEFCKAVFTVTPGTVYDIVIGAGGAGGAHDAAGAGGDATTMQVHAGAYVATFRGGGGGSPGLLSNDAAKFVWGLGGPVCSQNSFTPVQGDIEHPYWNATPGTGGIGAVNTSVAEDGRPNAVGGVGGTHGSNGTDDAGYLGAGGSGGGGGGPYGAGGHGGNGGQGSSIAIGYAGTAGTAAAANTGAGGGGGGSGGSGTTPFTNGNDGGAGGSGKLTISWFEYIL